MMDLRNRLKELTRGIQTVLLYFVDDFKTYVFKLRGKFKLKDREVIKEISHIFFSCEIRNSYKTTSKA